MTIDTVATPGVAHPWHTIWFSPRRTMRALIESDVRPAWTLVVGLAAWHGALATIAGLAVRGQLSFSMAFMPTVIGVLQVVFGVIVGPFLLALSGGWFGGDADPAEIRQSVAWSYAPYAVSLIAWIPILMLYWTAAAPPTTEAMSGVELLKALLLLAVSALQIGAILWVAVLQVITLAEVQHFAIWRAIGSIAVFLVPVLLLTVVN